MSQSELEYYITGAEEKERESWEQTRTICFYMVITQTGSRKFKTPQDLFPLPWDKKTVQKKKMTQEELNKLSDQLKAIQNGQEKH